MKNVHLLLSDKPSRLHEFGDIWFSHKEPTECFRNYNICITSDEEIKEGDKGWLLENNGITKNISQYDCTKGLGGIYPTDKKIILTTDQDLINDGVQAIDDEFLEWFVENPSCEFVPFITSTILDKSLYKTNIGFEGWRKENPKQETLEEAAENYYKQFENLPVIRFNAFIAGGKWQTERIFEWLSNKDYLSDDVKYIKKEWFEQFKKK